MLLCDIAFMYWMFAANVMIWNLEADFANNLEGIQLGMILHCTLEFVAMLPFIIIFFGQKQ